MAVPVALLVDDDPVFTATVARAMKDKPVILEIAHDAATAMKMLSAKQYSGLVLDLVLEDGSGFDVLQHIRRTGISLPTVIVTAKLPSFVREMLDHEQVKLVFPKPVDAKLLATVVLGLCGIAS